MADGQTEHVVKIVADTSNLEKGLDNADKKLDGVDKKAEGVGKSFKSIGDSLKGVFANSFVSDLGRVIKECTDLPEIGRDIANTVNKVKNIGNAVADKFKGAGAVSEETEKVNKLGEAAEETANKVGIFQRFLDAVRGPEIDEFERISDDLAAAADQANYFKDTWMSLTKHSGYFSKEADTVRAEIADIEAKMQELGNQKISSEDYKWLQDSLAAADKRLEGYLDRQDKMKATGVKENSTAWRNLQYDISIARQEMAGYKEEMASMRADGSAFTMGVDTDAYKGMAEQLEAAKFELAGIEAEGVTGFGAIAAAGLSAAGSIAVAFGSKVVSGIKKLGSALLNTAKHFVTLGKNARRTDGLIRKSFKTFTNFFNMLKTRIKRKLISSLFEDFDSNFRKLAQISPEFNAGVSGMIDSVKALGAQIVAAAEPIVSVLAPIISKVIDMLTAGADQMAQFVARLTGNTSYVQAIKGQSDYAASLDNTAKSTAKADKAAKDYKRTVLGFDQLNKMNGDDASADVLGIDEAELQTAETKATAINDIASRIYEAFSAKDFKKAGRTVAEAVNTAFSWAKNALGWKSNGNKIRETLKGVSDTINGFIEGFDGSSAGSAIGDIINTGINSIGYMLDPQTGVDFKGLGSRIGESATAMFREINWSGAGAAFMDGVQGLMNIISGVFKTDGFFSSIGSGLADGLRGALRAVRPEDIGDVLSSIVNGVADFTISLFGDIRIFEDAGTKFAESINDAISKIEPEKVITAIEDLVSSVCTFLYNAIVETDWAAVGNLLWEIFKGLCEDAWNGVLAWWNGSDYHMEGVTYNGNHSSWNGGSGSRHGSRIAGYAGGGIIGDGQLFIANEGGKAELIGGDGRGNTAVVNNGQIIDAVVTGVRQAMMEAVMMMDRGDNGDGGEIVLMVDSEELARASMRGQRRIDKRQNPTVSFA